MQALSAGTYNDSLLVVHIRLVNFDGLLRAKIDDSVSEVQVSVLSVRLSSFELGAT